MKKTQPKKKQSNKKQGKKKQRGKEVTRAFFLGRFQPVHNGHLQVMMHILRTYDELIIVLGSAQEHNTWRNPFTAEERKRMILAALPPAERKRTKVYFVPDINDDKRYVAYVEQFIPHCSLMFCGSYPTLQLFEAKGYTVEKLGRIDNVEGTKVRGMIEIDDLTWKSLVPLPVVKILEKIKGVERIKRLRKKKS